METSVKATLKLWLQSFAAELVTVYPLCYTHIYKYLPQYMKLFNICDLIPLYKIAF